MNYIKESEEILKNYRKLSTSLNYLQKRKMKVIKKGFPKDAGGYNMINLQYNIKITAKAQ